MLIKDRCMYDGGLQKKHRIITFFLIFIQVFFPVSLSFSSVANANTKENEFIDFNDDMAHTIDGINSLINADDVSPSLSTNLSIKNEDTTPFLKDNNFTRVNDHDLNVFDSGSLPSLGSVDISDEKENAEARMAQGAVFAGQTLFNGDVNAIDASIDYARGIGENILNQEVNDWLNQFGNARFSFGSNKTGDADLLVPIIDNPNSIVFTQIGIRSNEDRSTTNVGLGYRQYQTDWMWGVNSFYDYDLTGSNSRFGLGAELWADYFKLAANSYLRITDWHQSKLSKMRDYDERPANGFDVRAEGYLPSYAQLGAFAKYEKYFGDGVDLNTNTSPDSLKGNPSATTVGVTYTPFPLLTFKGQTARGNSNDNNIGMELTYRFGMPLSAQLDPAKVDLMRSLAGNRYDFVDRNYNIVMQYRKQDLLNISLPDSRTAEAAEIISVTATINKAKYGLKNISWSAPELISQGGTIIVTSKNTINLTLPPYVSKASSNEPHRYKLSAIGTDNEGNLSNTAVMWINVIPSKETITSLTLTPNNSILANDSDNYTAIALIKNEKGELLTGKDVTFTVSGFRNNQDVTLMTSEGDSGQIVTIQTDSIGRAVIKIKSKVSGYGILKATMKNGNSHSVRLSFIADASTARISDLILTKNNSLANGMANNIAEALVTDQFGNPVESFNLLASATNGAIVVTPSQLTNEEGKVNIKFNNTSAGNSVLTVNGSGATKSITGKFIADTSTARISSVVVSSDNAIANGKDKNTVIVTILDAYGNALNGALVELTVPSPAKYSTNPANSVTDSNGKLTINYTNTKSGPGEYSFRINNDEVTKTLTFKADSANPNSVQSSLNASPSSIEADGVDYSIITLILKDSFGNTIDGQVVNFISSLSNTTVSSVTDNGSGSYTAKLTGIKTGNTQITVTVNGVPFAISPVTISLVAGSPKQINSDIVVDKASYVAGGPVQVTVTLKDAQGNAVSGQSGALAGAVTVPNAAVKAGSSWAETGPGTGVYAITYEAQTAGTGLKAALQLTGWGGAVQSAAYAITADGGSATLISSNLTIMVDNQAANGKAKNQVKAVVTDAYGNVVQGQAVSFTSDNGASPASLSVTTNSNGEALFNVTNIKSGKTEITATVNGITQTISVNFIGDKATARITGVSLIGTVTSKLANSSDYFEFEAVV